MNTKEDVVAVRGMTQDTPRGFACHQVTAWWAILGKDRQFFISSSVARRVAQSAEAKHTLCAQYGEGTRLF
ncbi:MAG: hypothetical protein P8Y36_08030 [Alphaproteobacteria bacterium]